jgi:hypothetical protein
MSVFRKVFAGLVAMVWVGAAQATSHALVLDTTDMATDIGTVQTAVLAIGAAIITLFLAVKAYKWLRRAL